MTTRDHVRLADELIDRVRSLRLGAERLVYGRWTHGAGDELVILRTEEGHPVPAIGSTICVTPRADKIHYFDASTGKRKEAP